MVQENKTWKVAAAGAVAAGLASALLYRAYRTRQPVPHHNTPLRPRSRQNSFRHHHTPAVLAAPDPSKIAVVYATVSGTAELFAKSVAAESIARGVTVQLLDAADLHGPGIEALHSAASDAELLNALGALFSGCGTVIVITSTHGEGVAPEAAAPLLKALEAVAASRHGRALPGMQHLVFGLGDSGHKYFCRAGALFDAAFVGCGSTPVLPLTKGDARGDLEGTFDAWLERLWDPLSAATGVTFNAAAALNATPLPQLTFAFRDDQVPPAAPFAKKPAKIAPTQRLPFEATLKSVRQLVASKEGRPTVEAIFDVTGSGIVYEAGDHLGVLFRNPAGLVERVLNAIGTPEADRARTVELTVTKKTPKRTTTVNTLPQRVSLRDAFSWYVDLAGRPRRSTIRTLARYATNAADKATLAGALADHTAFSKFLEHHRTIADVLEAFPSSACIPVGHLLEVLPKIAPRYYSIASDSLPRPTEIRISPVSNEGGLVSPWLTGQATPGDKLFVFVRRAGFTLSESEAARPIIMVGAGTGIAPYVGFCERRAHWQQHAPDKTLGEAWLYFGCRSSTVDYLFQAELEQWLDAGVLTRLRPAFSREGASKVYVQHLVAADAAELWRLLDAEKAFLYICGDASRMAKDVEETIVLSVLEGVGQLSTSRARAYFAELERDGRVMKDVWTSAAAPGAA